MNTLDITDMIDSMNDPEEIKKYMEAQAKTLQKYSKENTVLRKNVAELERKVETLNAKLKADGLDETVDTQSDAETIVVTQLRLLKDKALQMELTMEETKKAVELMRIYQMSMGKKADVPSTKEIDTKELLKMLGNS